MARQFLTGLNLNKNELLNARIQNLALDPSDAVAGQIYYNTSTNVLKYYTGSTWLTLAQGGSVQDAITAAIDALTTSDIEEGSNLYFTDERAQDAVAAAIAAGTHSNITITYDDSTNKFTFEAENGVADSTTDDLAEGTTNKYFTDERAQDAVGNALGDGLKYDDASGAVSLDYSPTYGAIGVNGVNGYVEVKTDGISIDTSGSASQLRVLTGETSPVASKTYAADQATTAVTTHNNTTSGVHGVTGNVVGTSDSQTLTNKELSTGTSLGADLDASSNKITNLTDPTLAQDAATKNYVDTEIADHADDTTGVHGVTGDVVGTENTQTLTNKTLGTNTALGANLDADSNRITNLAGPVDANDAATKAYVDAAVEGLHVHASVAAATTANVDLTPGNAPSIIDGVTLTDQMRILVKSQTASAENGIYIYDLATDALVRASDYDTAVEIDTGDFVFVDGGTTYGNTGWVQTEVVATLNTDPISWVQFSGAGTYTAGDGLTLDGTEFNVVGTADRITVTADSVDIASTYVGQTSITTLGTVTTGTWNGSTIAIANGGTGATTEAGAKTNLGFMTRYTVANPLLTSVSGGIEWVVTHNLGTKHVIVQVYDLNTDDEVIVDIERTNTNQVTLTWVSATDVTADNYQVVIIG